MGEIVQTVVNFCKEKICDYKSLDDNMPILQRRIEELRYRKKDLEEELREAKFQSGKKRRREIDNWLRNVRGKKKEFQTLEQEVQQCRFYRRFQLAKSIDKMIKEVGELLDQGTFPERLLLDVYRTRGELFLTTKMVGQAFSRKLEEILAWLKNDEVSSVGIYGMAGVGKTTLAMHIHNDLRNSRSNDLRNSRSFRRIFWVSVSQNFSIREFQDDIAKITHVDLSEEEDEKKRASKLCNSFRRWKKFVLIFDNLGKHFELDKVGIPSEREKCKLIITTRLLDVCRRMSCQRSILMNPLPRDEAWDLFKEKLGHGTELSLEVTDIAKRVANKCGGLPLGIVTMAASMRGVNSIHKWRDVLEELDVSTTGQEDMEDKVFPILKSSYNCLSAKLQFCFLYCVLFPKGYPWFRGELINYFVAEGLMDGRKSRQAAFDMGQTLLDKLVDCCLLTEYCWFKMHDLIRDMALRVTRESCRYMIKTRVQLSEIPDEQEWTEDLEKVSLMENNISTIPQEMSPRCPRLSTLMLQKNPLKGIPDSFFEHLPGLRVLNLRHTSIKKLPESISNLKNLRALLVGWCKSLKYVPPLGNLRELRELDLLGTRIHVLPELGVENLVNLKVVGMEGIGHLEKLKNLEEFAGNLSLNEYNQFLKLELRLHRFTLAIRELTVWEVRVAESDNDVGFEKCSFKEDKLLLPEKIQRLYIENCQDMGRCLSDICPSLNKAWELRLCRVSDCEEIECILRQSSFSDEITEAEEESRWAPLPRLEVLDILRLPNFTGLCQREGAIARAPLLPRGAFSNLKELFIVSCPKLKAPLTPRLLQHIPNLEDLAFFECEGLEEIIAEDEVEGEGMGGSSTSSSGQSYDDSPLTHSKSWIIWLGDLPNLRRISRRSLSSIRKIYVETCPKLKTIPFFFPLVDGQASTPPNLEWINIDDTEWWESLEWEHHNAKNVLEPFLSKEYY